MSSLASTNRVNLASVTVTCTRSASWTTWVAVLQNMPSEYLSVTTIHLRKLNILLTYWIESSNRFLQKRIFMINKTRYYKSSTLGIIGMLAAPWFPEVGDVCSLVQSDPADAHTRYDHNCLSTRSGPRLVVISCRNRKRQP